MFATSCKSDQKQLFDIFGLLYDINEVLEPDALLPRAYEVARQLLRTPPLVRRYTRVLLTQRLRAQLHDALSYGFAMEGHALA